MLLCAFPENIYCTILYISAFITVNSKLCKFSALYSLCVLIRPISNNFLTFCQDKSIYGAIIQVCPTDDDTSAKEQRRQVEPY